MAREAMDICLRVLKESNKSRFDSYSVRNSVLIISHITFRVCHVHIFTDKLSRDSCIPPFSIYQISEWQFSHVLIGSRNSERPDARQRLVQEDEICAINEAVVQTNTNKATNFGLSVFTDRQKIIFMLNLQQKQVVKCT